MGKTKAAKVEDETKTANTPNDDGWEPVSAADGPQNWLIKEAGTVIQGRLLGRFQKRGKNRGDAYFYQVKLSAGGVPAVHGRGEDREEISLEAGEIINVDESAALKDLAPLCKDGGVYVVRLSYGEKVELDGGNTFWPVKIVKKTLRAPKPTVETTEPDSTIPF